MNSFSMSERKNKGIFFYVCWNGLKHVWFSALQYIQGVRSAREKFGKVALKKKKTSLRNKEN